MLVAKFNALAGTLLLASGDGGGGEPNPLVFDVDLALWTLFIFLGLMAVLTKFAWKPIMEGLNAREKGIADDIENARLASEQADNNLQQYEAKLASVNDEASAILAEAKRTRRLLKKKFLPRQTKKQNELVIELLRISNRPRMLRYRSWRKRASIRRSLWLATS